jgi:hypothetical protein
MSPAPRSGPRRWRLPAPRDPSLMQQPRFDTPAKLAAHLALAGFASPHAMAGRFEHPFTADQIVALQLGIGAPGRRLPSLPPELRAACVEHVRARLKAMPEDDLVYRPEVVWAVAHRP